MAAAVAGQPNTLMGSLQRGSYAGYGQLMGRGESRLAKLTEMLTGTQPSVAELNNPMVQTSPVQLTFPGQAVPGVQIPSAEQSQIIWKEIGESIQNLFAICNVQVVTTMEEMGRVRITIIRADGGLMQPLPETVIGQFVTFNSETVTISQNRYGATLTFSIDKALQNPVAFAKESAIFKRQMSNLLVNTIYAMIMAGVSAGSLLPARPGMGDGTRDPAGFNMTTTDVEELVSRMTLEIGALNKPGYSPLEVLNNHVNRHNMMHNRSGKMYALVGENIAGIVRALSAQSSSLFLDGKAIESPFGTTGVGSSSVEILAVPPIFDANQQLRQVLSERQVFTSFAIINPLRRSINSNGGPLPDPDKHRMGGVFYDHPRGQYRHVPGANIIAALADMLFNANGNLNDFGKGFFTGFGTVADYKRRCGYAAINDDAGRFADNARHQGMRYEELFVLSEAAKKIDEHNAKDVDRVFDFAAFTKAAAGQALVTHKDNDQIMDAIGSILMASFCKFLSALGFTPRINWNNQDWTERFAAERGRAADAVEAFITAYETEAETSYDSLLQDALAPFLRRAAAGNGVNKKLMSNITRTEFIEMYEAGFVPAAAMCVRPVVNEVHNVLFVSPNGVYLRTSIPLVTYGETPDTRTGMYNVSFYGSANVIRPEDVSRMNAFGLGRLVRGGSTDIVTNSELAQRKYAFTPDNMANGMIVVPIHPFSELAKNAGAQQSVSLTGSLSRDEFADLNSTVVQHLNGEYFDTLFQFDSDDNSPVHGDAFKPSNGNVMFPRFATQCALGEIGLRDGKPVVVNTTGEVGAFCPHPTSPYPVIGWANMRSNGNINRVAAPVDQPDLHLKHMSRAIELGV